MVILVPCYNEETRLPVQAYKEFLIKNTDHFVFFINDGSSDCTLNILNTLKTSFSNQIQVLDLKKNVGKAEAIRTGALYLLNENRVNHIAYLDADLATSLEECASYQQYLVGGKKFVFASRILKIGSVIERKFHRFIIGRIIATFISNILQIKVYDTQCGCKVFDRETAQLAFEKPFVSKWLFDVEIFSRIIKHYGKENALEIMEEIPVRKWVDKGESKVKLSYFFRMWFDLIRIRKIHNT